MSLNIISSENFGKDHYSLLAYIESLCVDGREGIGQIDKTRMRCNETTHPTMLGSTGSITWNVSWKPKFSTRLKGFFEFKDHIDTEKAISAGFQVDGHDDWDCLTDLEEAGFVAIVSLTNNSVKMTEKGSKIVAQLRQHKTNGGNFANFKLA